MSNLTADPKDLMTLREVATQLNVHYNTVYRWITKEYILPALKVGGRYRVKRSDLDDFLDGAE